MKYFLISLTLLCSLLFMSSCREDSLITSSDIILPDVINNIEATINGYIIDSDGNPIEDAEIKLSSETTFTNSLGFFEITALVNEKFTLLKVRKDGYFDQFQTITPSSSIKAISNTKIRLFRKSMTAYISSSEESVVNLSSNASVTFQANSFVDENNNPYEGTVYVYGQYIDPTQENIEQIMPGNLLAIDKENELSLLQSFGMINVQILNPSYEKLNISKPATISMNLPASLSNSAPLEIPLWHFDEDLGVWKEEGTASLINGKYEGVVDHFTFWNCDIPFDVTFIKGKVSNRDEPFFSKIRLTDLATGQSYTSLADSEGGFSGFVPKNTNLLLEIIGACSDNQVLYSTNIGPFYSDSEDIGNIVITDGEGLTLLTGKLVDCNNTPLKNGKLFITNPTTSFYQEITPDENGSFSKMIYTCDFESLHVKGMNIDEDLVSPTINFPNTNEPEIDAGVIEVCLETNVYKGSVTFTFVGEEKTFDNCTVTKSFSSIDNIDYYSFKFSEPLPSINDQLSYSLFTGEANNNINDPYWFEMYFSVFTPQSAENVIYYTLHPELENDHITVEKIALFPGDIMVLSAKDFIMKKITHIPNDSNESSEYLGSTLSINAVLQ